jgi:hypothetical protein
MSKFNFPEEKTFTQTVRTPLYGHQTSIVLHSPFLNPKLLSEKRYKKSKKLSSNNVNNLNRGSFLNQDYLESEEQSEEHEIILTQE